MSARRVREGLLWSGCFVLLLACGGKQASPADSSGAGASAAGSTSTAGAGTAGSRPAQGGHTNSAAGAGGRGGEPLPMAGSAGEPQDNRPPRPTWDPPFELGAPGWQGSDKPLCEKHVGYHEAFDVWSDSGGVYALLSEGCNELAGTPCGAEGLTVQFNDGSGWQSIYHTDATPNLHLRGLPAGPAVLVGLQCGIALLDSDGNGTCSTPLQGLPPADVFGVSSDHAYAIDDARVLEYTGGTWQELATLPNAAEAIWADDQNIVAVGFNQAVYLNTGSGFNAMAGVPAGDYVSVWAFAVNDIWLGNRVGQLVHFDGASWSVLPSGSTRSIDGLWGAEGQLFFRTAREFGRSDGHTAEILLAGPGADADNPRIEIGGLWGRSAKEVFVSLVDANFQDYACGEHFMVWFDGDEFHEF